MIKLTLTKNIIRLVRQFPRFETEQRLINIELDEHYRLVVDGTVVDSRNVVEILKGFQMKEKSKIVIKGCSVYFIIQNGVAKIFEDDGSSRKIANELLPVESAALRLMCRSSYSYKSWIII